jgi:hypothetical protein
MIIQKIIIISKASNIFHDLLLHLNDAHYLIADGVLRRGTVLARESNKCRTKGFEDFYPSNSFRLSVLACQETP